MTSKEIILKTMDLPAVPVIAAKVIQLIDNPTTSLDDLQKSIVADQAMTSRILKIANSSFYGVRQNIDTITEALSILGLKVTRLIVLAAATRGIYKRFGVAEQKLWEHSLGVSIAAGIVAAERDNNIKREEAVVAGLLHDIGKVVINNTYPEKYAQIIRKVHATKQCSINVENEILGFNHTEVGYLLGKKWGFPDELCEAILRHHSPDAESSEYPNAGYIALTSTIALSDAICVGLGVGYMNPMPEINLGVEKWIKSLGMSDQRLKEITDIFNKTYSLEKGTYY